MTARGCVLCAQGVRHAAHFPGRLARRVRRGIQKRRAKAERARVRGMARQLAKAWGGTVREAGA